MNHKLAFMFSRRFFPNLVAASFYSSPPTCFQQMPRSSEVYSNNASWTGLMALQDPNKDWHLHRTTVCYHQQHRCLSLLCGSNYWLQLDLGHQWNQVDIAAVHGESLHCGLRQWYSGDFDYSDVEAAYTDVAPMPRRKDLPTTPLQGVRQGTAGRCQAECPLARRRLD